MTRRLLLVASVVLFAISSSFLANSANGAARTLKLSWPSPNPAAKGKFGDVLKGTPISTTLKIESKGSGTDDAGITGTTFGGTGNKLTIDSVTKIGSYPASVKIYGTFGQYDSKVNVSGTLPFTTAKSAPATNNVKYMANVGWATKVTKKPSGLADFSKSSTTPPRTRAGRRTRWRK